MIAKENTVLIDNLHFANGVALSEGQDFVLVAETGRSRVHRYHLDGRIGRTSDIFLDGLPGLPDNLKPDGEGGFFVPLITARDADNPLLTQAMGPFPLIRKLVARVICLIELLFKVVQDLYPNEYSEKAVHFVSRL